MSVCVLCVRYDKDAAVAAAVANFVITVTFSSISLTFEGFFFGNR
jgi:hypothetical protein